MEGRFYESTAKAMPLEVQLKTADLKVRSVEGRAMVAEKKAIAIELVARAAKTEAERAIKGCIKSTDFKDEVGEVACNAFEKGFEECKRRVSEVFKLLDLSEISMNEPAPSAKVTEAEMIGTGSIQGAEVGKAAV